MKPRESPRNKKRLKEPMAVLQLKEECTEKLVSLVVMEIMKRTSTISNLRELLMNTVELSTKLLNSSQLKTLTMSSKNFLPISKRKALRQFQLRINIKLRLVLTTIKVNFSMKLTFL